MSLRYLRVQYRVPIAPEQVFQALNTGRTFDGQMFTIQLAQCYLAILLEQSAACQEMREEYNKRVRSSRLGDLQLSRAIADLSAYIVQANPSA